jgi:hypothetical protein
LLGICFWCEELEVAVEGIGEGRTGVVDSLVERKVLPYDLAPILREVISACNKAIHGAHISDKTTESVVRVRNISAGALD